MTQEEKQLLIKDLCARLPYGIMVSVQGGEFDSYKYPYILTAVSKFGLDSFCRVYHAVYTPFGVPNVEDVKPYLRPISSMTDKEIEFMDDIGFRVYKKTNDFDNVCDVSDDGWDKNYVDKQSFEDVIDFFCSHHLDYRNLIEKGLALEAPEGMYKIK